jgi:hypothetical protein
MTDRQCPSSVARRPRGPRRHRPVLRSAAASRSRIRLQVVKGERISAAQIGEEFLARALIDEQINVALRVQRVVVTAVRTHQAILFEPRPVEDLPAAGALVEDVRGQIAAIGCPQLLFRLAEPAQAASTRVRGHDRASYPAALDRHPLRYTERKKCGEQERAAVAQERQRNPRDRHHADRHADVDERVREPRPEDTECDDSRKGVRAAVRRRPISRLRGSGAYSRISTAQRADQSQLLSDHG